MAERQPQEIEEVNFERSVVSVANWDYGSIESVTSALQRRRIERVSQKTSTRRRGDAIVSFLARVMQEALVAFLNLLNKRLSAGVSEPAIRDTARQMAQTASGLFHGASVRSRVEIESVVADIRTLADKTPSLTLPETAPERYSKAKGDPVAFYWRVWGIYAEAYILYQFELRRRDPLLYQRLHEHCKYHQQSMAEDFKLPSMQTYTERNAGNPDLAGVRAKRALKQRVYRSRNLDSFGRS